MMTEHFTVQTWKPSKTLKKALKTSSCAHISSCTSGRVGSSVHHISAPFILLSISPEECLTGNWADVRTRRKDNWTDVES